MEDEVMEAVGAGTLDSPQTEMEVQSLSQPAAEESPLSLRDIPPLQGGHEQFRDHIRGLVSQGQALKASIPGFDIRRELNDPMFARLTSPQVGLSVEDAYYALHRRELQQQAARMAAGSISRSIQAGQLRPRENGGAQAGSVQTMDYSKATKEQREQLKTAIRNASARGEKIYP